MLFFVGFFPGCGNNIPFGREIYLVRPVNLQVEALPNLRFKISYSVQNQELSFDGYNLYISRSPISEGQVYSSLSPLSRDGGLPTFRHRPEDFNPNQLQEVIIERYVDTVTKFEAGIRYYFRMTAHSRETSGSIESRPSNEVERAAIP